MPGTTPGRTTHVYIGGTRTVLTEPAHWAEHVMAEIGVPGSETEDHVVFVPGVGYRLADYRSFGNYAYEQGKDDDASILHDGKSYFALYSDTPAGSDPEPLDVPAKPRHNQRALPELALAASTSATQTTQGDRYVKKHARPALMVPAYVPPPAPASIEPVPLDHCTASTDLYNADDRFHFMFCIRGSGSRTLGPVFRAYFPGCPGRTKSDGSLYGVGAYALTFQGDGIVILHEKRNDDSWAKRASFAYCESSRVMGNAHRITVESDASRDGSGKVFGRHLRFGFSSIPGQGDTPLIYGLLPSNYEPNRRTILDASSVYRIPGAQAVTTDSVQSRVAIDARGDCSCDFQAIRLKFFPTGTLRCRTISLAQAPTASQPGVVHVQVFGSFPTGTTATLKLYGATSGTLCANSADTTNHVDNLIEKAQDFVALAGERSYILNVEMAAKSDGFACPTVQRVRHLREATFTTVSEDETEIKNVEQFSITGAGANPSTESLGLVCRDYTGTQNPVLVGCEGKWIRVEQDLGPDPMAGTDGGPPAGTRVTSVLFRGIVREAKRRVRSGAGVKQGFGGGGHAPEDRALHADHRQGRIRVRLADQEARAGSLGFRLRRDRGDGARGGPTAGGEGDRHP